MLVEVADSVQSPERMRLVGVPSKDTLSDLISSIAFAGTPATCLSSLSMSLFVEGG